MAIGSLAVRVSTNTTQFNKGMSGASKRARQFGRDTSHVAKKAALMGAAITAAAGTVAVLTARSIQSTKEMANLASMANASANTFQKMAFGARTMGIEQEKLADILKDVNDRVGDFLSTGGGPMADFFEKIAPKVGVTAQQFERLSGPEALQLYVSSLERANLSQQEMTFFMEAMASDATKLLPLLRNNGEQMGIFADKAERMGIALSDVEVEQIKQAGIAIDDMGSLFSGFTDQIVAELSPVLIAFSKMLNQNAEDMGGVGEIAADSFNVIVDGISEALNGLSKMERNLLTTQTTIDVFAESFRIGLLQVAREIVEIPTNAVNEMIMAINKIPGIDIDTFGMSDWGKGLTNQIDESEKEILRLRGVLAHELNKPLPGEQFKRFVFEAKAAGEESAQAMLDARRKMEEALNQRKDDQGESGNEGTDFSLTAEEIAKREEEKAKLKREKMMEAFEQEATLTSEFNLRLADLRDLKEDSDLASEEQYQKARLDKMRSFFNEQYGIQSSGYDALGNLAAKHWNAETAMAVDALGSIVNAFSGQSRKMFEIQKAAGIANAIISTYEGASAALKLGWPLGPIAATAITANGLAKVQAIRSQSFGGGGGSGNAGGGSTSLAGAGVAQQQAEEIRRTTSVDISLIGADSRDRAVAGSVIEQINDEIDRGGRISRVGLA